LAVASKCPAVAVCVGQGSAVEVALPGSVVPIESGRAAAHVNPSAWNGVGDDGTVDPAGQQGAVPSEEVNAVARDQVDGRSRVENGRAVDLAGTSGPDA
jgi:hypothetical protein